jgi:hypothetical protein
MVSGGFNDATGKYLSSTEFWDTDTNEVKDGTFQKNEK